MDDFAKRGLAQLPRGGRQLSIDGKLKACHPFWGQILSKTRIFGSKFEQVQDFWDRIWRRSYFFGVIYWKNVNFKINFRNI